MKKLYNCTFWQITFLTYLLLIKVCFSFAQAKEDTLILKLDNSRGSIQWEQSFDKINWTNVTNGNGSQVKIGVTKTSYFRAKVTENNCAPIFSNQKAVFIDNNFRVSATSVKGNIILPANGSLDWSRYDVRSVIDVSQVQAGGEFNVFATDSTDQDLLMVTDRVDNSIIMLGYFLGKQDSYMISAETTALALLMMNPYSEIGLNIDKARLIEAYKSSEEFKGLLAEVEKSIQARKSLADPTNPSIREAIGKFSNKDFKGGRMSKVGPILTENTKGNAWFQNSSSVSYSGMIVKRGDTKPIEKFFLAGTLLINSDYLNFRKTFSNTLNNAAREFTYDFSKLAPGDYEIILSNGLNLNEGNPEDQKVLQENAGLLVYAFIDKVLPVSNIIKGSLGTGGCFNEFVALAESEIKIYAMDNGGNLKPDWHIDVLTKLSKGIIRILDHEDGCQINPNTRAFFRDAFELFIVYEKYKELAEFGLTLLDFSFDYYVHPSVIPLCKFVDPLDSNIYNCFTLRKITGGDNQRAYVCDTLSSPLLVQLVEDKKYYPQEEPMEDFTVVWQKPDKTFATSKTDYAGYAQLKGVVLTDEPGEQITTASIARLDPKIGIIQQVEFKATASRPILKVVTYNDKQTGEIGKQLTKPIILSIVDGFEPNFVLLNRFNVKPEITGGGTLEADETSTTPIGLGFIWKLGPKEGEQTVTFTINNKRCSPWQIQGNPVTFKATAEDPPKPSTIEGMYYGDFQWDNDPENRGQYKMTHNVSISSTPSGNLVTLQASTQFAPFATVTGPFNGSSLNLSSGELYPGTTGKKVIFNGTCDGKNISGTWIYPSGRDTPNSTGKSSGVKK